MQNITLKQEEFASEETLTITEQPDLEATDTDEEEQERETFLQIIYMSAATVPFTEQELAEILSKSKANNEKVEVSGLLIYHEGSFLQVLEGPEEAVLETYERIGDDPRHTEVGLLLKQKVLARSFGNWEMGYVNTNKSRFKQEEGYIDFFRRGFSLPVMRADKSMIGKVLREFKEEGKWRSDIS